MGDRISVGGTYYELHGSHHTVITGGQQDPQQALAHAVEQLRRQLPDGERADVDDATRRLAEEPPGTPGWRCALRDLAGIASVIGSVGAPVIEAVRRVLAAVGS